LKLSLKTWAGIFACIGAGALWGLAFIAPLAVVPYSGFELVAGRYIFFAATSGVLLAIQAKAGRTLRADRIRQALYFGLIGYVGFFVFAAYGVRLAGPALAALIVGLTPVAVAFIGNRRNKIMPWRNLAAPLGAICAGLVIVNFGALDAVSSGHAAWKIISGVTCSVFSLAAFVYFVIRNDEVSKAADAPSVILWTGWVGIGACAGSLPLLLLDAALGHATLFDNPLFTQAGGRFLAWAALLGIASSWLATSLWIFGSRRVPVVLASQLIIAETVFGLFYGFLYQQRWPTGFEAIGSLLMILGVVLGILTFAQSKVVAKP
jgi:drug/metabolite transporter (DMT)-like permease